MTSLMPALNRCRSMCPPTVSNPSRIAASNSSSIGSSGPAAGISPKRLWIIDAVRLTRLPQPATSSELLRWTNSAQVKSLSWFSGPAAQMK
ncbi:MAG: hypothetical protein BWY91_03235 [bacterium ADurb.BinA028]|nr:MAG: hypothetical protein BWY91_03235 [bacterium ADurb.BinA028]